MIAIIDYRAGNLTSVKLALQSLSAEARITSDPREILAADRVVFPGVGAAAAAMKNLSELGLVPVVRQVVAEGKPFLGICLGTQIIFSHSEEDGGVDCVGLIPGTVRLFQPSDPWDKVPQMGWNSVRMLAPHPVFSDIDQDSEFYFVHSYYPSPAEQRFVLGQTEYADAVFASVVGSGSLVATQFHPEKSGRIGLRLLDNFVKWNGKPC